jgi:hypothetical protein
MTKGRAIAVAVVSGIVGLGVGVLGAVWWMSWFQRYGTLTAAEAHLVVGARVLEDLRASDTASAEHKLQVWLDGDLLTVGANSEPGHTPRATTLQAISQIRESRNASGYVPANPSVRAAVEQTLALGTHE